MLFLGVGNRNLHLLYQPTSDILYDKREVYLRA